MVTAFKIFTDLLEVVMNLIFVNLTRNCYATAALYLSVGLSCTSQPNTKWPFLPPYLTASLWKTTLSFQVLVREMHCIRFPR